MKASVPKCQMGITGLDEVLLGGLPANRLYLLRGNPGVGKTTLAMQFLLEGDRHGEKGFYVTLSETKSEIEDIANSHEWDLGSLDIFELSALEELAESADNTVFHPSEIELNKTTDLILRKIDECNPKRVVLDSLSELRLLSDSPLRYRRQMLALKQYFAGKQITVLLLDDHAAGSDLQVQSIAHGVINIEAITSEYGAERRRIKIDKLRGVNFVGGYHDAAIVPGGMVVFPRLVAATSSKAYPPGQLKSNIEHFDQLLGGGIDCGTSCLFLGPAGSGKSSLVAQFAVAAAERGEKSLMLLFEETLRVTLARAEGIGMPLQKYIDEGLILVRQLDPGELLPGQFVHFVKEAVDTENVKMVLVDSLNGYLQAMSDVKFLNVQLHELLTFLSHRGIVTIITLAQHGILGTTMSSPVDLTYLADSVVLFRYFEQGGEIKKAVSVLKKRIGKHEATIRQISTDSKGIRVGEILREFHGVLTGTPTFEGDDDTMIKKR